MHVFVVIDSDAIILDFCFVHIAHVRMRGRLHDLASPSSLAFTSADYRPSVPSVSDQNVSISMPLLGMKRLQYVRRRMRNRRTSRHRTTPAHNQSSS